MPTPRIFTRMLPRLRDDEAKPQQKITIHITTEADHSLRSRAVPPHQRFKVRLPQWLYGRRTMRSDIADHTDEDASETLLRVPNMRDGRVPEYRHDASEATAVASNRRRHHSGSPLIKFISPPLASLEISVKPLPSIPETPALATSVDEHVQSSPHSRRVGEHDHPMPCATPQSSQQHPTSRSCSSHPTSCSSPDAPSTPSMSHIPGLDSDVHHGAPRNTGARTNSLRKSTDSRASIDSEKPKPQLPVHGSQGKAKKIAVTIPDEQMSAVFKSGTVLQHGDDAYTLLNAIGLGGFGLVYRARTGNGELVAVKTMAKAHLYRGGRSLESVDCAIMEHQIMKAATETGNTWVTHLLASWEDAENIYFVMVSFLYPVLAHIEGCNNVAAIVRLRPLRTFNWHASQ